MFVSRFFFFFRGSKNNILISFFVSFPTVFIPADYYEETPAKEREF